MSEETIIKGGRRIRKQAAGIISAASLLLALLGTSVWYIRTHNQAHATPSPIPAYITKAVSFPLYYPMQKDLPAGYRLDLNSFKHPVQNGVVYAVVNDRGQKLIFSLQPKPSEGDLQNFTSSYIPLHNTYQTPSGQALLGAYKTKEGTETFVSLPTNSNTWIIVTAPYNIDQTQLKQVLSSLTS